MAIGSETAQSATDDDTPLVPSRPKSAADEGTPTQDPPDDGSDDEFEPL